MALKNYCFKFKNRKGLLFLQTNQIYDDRKLFKGEVAVESLETYIIKGTTYHPYAHLPDPYNLAISEKFRSILNDSGITGWRTYPINIKDCEYKYYGLQIFGRTGFTKRPVKSGWVHGMNIDMTNWDGSDIFCSSDTFLILFTEKVKNILLSSKLFSQEEVIDLEEYEWYSS